MTEQAPRTEPTGRSRRFRADLRIFLEGYLLVLSPVLFVLAAAGVVAIVRAVH